MGDFERFQKLVDDSNYIVFFGGAGVSTASGIPDFRGADGLYTKKSEYAYKPEYLLSHECFMEHTDEFFKFYKEKMCVLDVEPCMTHKKLAELEKIGKLKAVITQNVDGLHQKAGSKNVIELHGTIHRNECMYCGKEFDAEYVKKSDGVPKCDECNNNLNIIKPCVTLYGEMLPYGAEEKASDEVAKADLLIVAGTTLNVYPAAGVIRNLDRKNGAKMVVINKEINSNMAYADMMIEGDMNVVFNKLQVR